MVKLNPGDLVRIEFTGRLASDQSVFETTDESLARQAGVWSSSAQYGPRLVLFGRGAMISGVEAGLSTLSPGQSGEFAIPVARAFGPRFPELVRVMPQKEFLRHGVQPQPNLIVSIDGVPALIKSVSSGRILLDFNHPLAGQELKYSLQLLEVIGEPEAKVTALGELFGVSLAVAETGGKKSVSIPKTLDAPKARQLSMTLQSALSGWEIKPEG